MARSRRWPTRPPDDGRVVSLPLDEHTPKTVREAGLVLEPVAVGRWRRGLLAGGAVAVVLGVLLVVTRDSPAPGLVDLDSGVCFEPLVTDLSAPVDEVDCGPGTAKVIQKVTSPADADAPHPGDGALSLLGQGACQSEVDADRLLVAVPSPGAWSAGDRVVVCAERQ